MTKALEGYVRAENALNQKYEEVANYAPPGRGIFCGMRWRFL